MLPLVFGLWQVALVFTALNAAVLTVRIREENRALRARLRRLALRAYIAALSSTSPDA